MRSEQINELATALAKAQGQIEASKTDSKNPFYNSNYSSLAAVWDAVRKPLTSNGLSVIQTIKKRDPCIIVETTLLHSSGQFYGDEFEMVLDKNNPQEAGKLITYMRRYGLAAITGTAQEDDDAETAMKRMKVGDQKHVAGETTLPFKGDPCEHTWKKSNYNSKEEYCSICKTKRPIKN